MSLALSAVACGSGISDSGTAQSAQGSVAPVGQSAEGPVRMVAGALSTIPLKADQRTEIESLIAASSARHRALFEGRGKVTAALADQIEKGTIDKNSLEPAASEQKAKEEKALAEDRAALTRLHALLTPEQREKFVAAIEAGFHKGMGHHGPHGKHGEGKPGDGPRGDRPEGPRGGPGGPGMHGPGPMGMMGLGKDLNLDDDQKAKMKEIFKEEFAAHANKGEFKGGPFAMKEALESFKTPNFDAAKLLPGHGEMGEKFVDLATKILPILKPEQRKIAADGLREHAKNPMPMMAPKPE